MVDVPLTLRTKGPRWPGFTGLIASRGFQRWAARFPLTRGLVRREGEALFDILAGFTHSQILMALVQMEIPQKLMAGAQSVDDLAQATATPPERMEILLRAAIALALIKRKRGGTYGLTRRGAALVGVPGLTQMIAHHDVLYRDLADPAAFFRGQTTPELAAFWPYVFGPDVAPETAQTYSDLMAQSQVLVAEDTLAAVRFDGIRHLMDVGGGTGAFLSAVGQAHGAMSFTLFDLPAVVPGATIRFAQAGLSQRTEIVPGSFRDGPLPEGADAISLVRVLYDHEDHTVAALLAACKAALPAGGRLIISEPMRGNPAPSRAGDVYFALYTLAMGTGRARSAPEIAALCGAAGFENIKVLRARRPFVTSCITAQKPCLPDS
jgi:demethylspheroidene O-methyltransferase